MWCGGGGGGGGGATQVPNTDIMDHDLLDTGHHAWTQSPTQLMFLCDTDPLCIGFNSNGFFKVADEGRYTIAGVDLYLKKSALPK